MSNRTLTDLLSQLERTTGKSYAPRTFRERLRIQKSVYLMRALGDRASSRYQYSQYFYGPYSPGLAKDYYALRPGSIDGSGVRAVPPNTVHGRRLAIVADAVRRGNDFLEAVVTVHSMACRNPDASKAVIQDLFGSVKEELAEKFEEAWTYLRAYGLIEMRT